MHTGIASFFFCKVSFMKHPNKQWSQCYLHLKWYFLYLSFCWSCQVSSSNWMYPGNLSSIPTSPSLALPCSLASQNTNTHMMQKKEKFQLSFYRPTFVIILLKVKFSCSQRKLRSFAFPGIIFAKSFLSSDSECEEVLDPSLEELEPSQFSFY